MPRKGRQGVLKRQRERKKAEKAEIKRAERAQRQNAPRSEGSKVADSDDLAAYGLVPEPEEERGRD